MIKEPLFSGVNTICSKKTGMIFGFLLAIILSSQSGFAQNDVSRFDNVKVEESKPVAIGKVSKTQNESPNLVPAATITENFDAGVLPVDWSIQNRSTTIGTNTNCWNLFTGVTPWAAQAGTGHIGANFNCTTGANTISGWLIGPSVTFNNGDQISFWTRKGSPDSFADRLELRISTNGFSTNVGTTSTSVGDFTTLLVSVNPTLVTGVYPTVFTQYTATISGLAGATNGRFAFRYFVTSGGPSGANSDIISIDTVTYQTVTTAANVSVGGYVSSQNGQALSRATVQMIDQSGNVQSAKTNSFGYYRFDEVRSGEDYVFNVYAKQHQFVSQIVNVFENIQELNFTEQ